MLHFFEQNDISVHLMDLELVAKSSSNFHKEIELFRHPELGRILIMNNEIQHIEAWAPLYHESLVHIAASFIPEISNVLILGGGSFYAAQEVLKYKSVKSVTMVDYDSAVIKIVSENYEHAQEIKNDSRFKLRVQDLVEFLETTDNKFDLIINDAIDLLDYEEELFKSMASSLTPDGACTDVIFRHVFESQRCQRTISILRRQYESAFSFIVIPEYPGMLHLLSMWSHSRHLNQNQKTPINLIQRKWINDNNSPCRFYDPSFLSYYLHLPPYIKKAVTVIE